MKNCLLKFLNMLNTSNNQLNKFCDKALLMADFKPISS